MTDAEKLALLFELIENQGFAVIEGDFVRRDGLHSPFFLKPVNVRKLLQAATQALG